MPAPSDRLAALADALERTMRALGAWSEPTPPLVPFARPFAMDSMPFEHWLQLVLVPRMREIAAAGAPLPPRSNLAAHAVREFDGRDQEMSPLVDVLRQIDELSPPLPSEAAGGGRRLGAGVALIVGLVAWTFLALWGSQRLVASSLTHFFPLTVVQSYVGTMAPGDDFRPLRIMVTAVVRNDGTTQATEVSLMLLRSMRTMSRGPTAPFDFAATEPPTTAAVLEWLGDFGVDPQSEAAHRAAAQAVAAVASASAARSPATLHDLPPQVTRVTGDALVEIPRRTPEWVEILTEVLAVLAGAVPITLVAVRRGRQ